MTAEPKRRLRPDRDGGVWGAYVEYLERLEAERDNLAATVAAIPDAHDTANLAHARVARDRYAAIVNAARTATERLLRQEQQHSGSGREGHLNEDDLVPLFEALGVVYLDDAAGGEHR